MDGSSITGLSHSAIMYLVHHTFLPPKLPQKDDSHPDHETLLLNTTIGALRAFKQCVTDDHHGAVDSVTDMVSTMVTLMDTFDSRIVVSEWKLRNALRDFSARGGMILLHIRAQNAGVMMSKVNQSIHVEAFELSPLNGPVVTTKGRLRRSFPGSAFALTAESFGQPDFQETVAHTLAKMSCQPAVDTKPKVRKAGRMHDENRDTTHPRIVTELFTAFLGPVGEPVAVPRVCKNTREEVLYCDALLPWRRSPAWMLLRVAMQLVFSRLAGPAESSTDYYKTFMLFLLGRILNLSLEHTLSSDLLYAMNAKLGRRLLKLDPSVSRPGLPVVHDIMEKTTAELRKRWDDVLENASPDPNLALLKGLDVDEDALIALDGLAEFIDSRFTGSSGASSSSFEPTPSLIKYQTDTAPNSLGYSAEYAVYNLQAFEAWVASKLPRWLENHEGDAETCEKLGSLIEMYYGAASTQYSGNPESSAILLLTVLELWVACDQSALHLCELLRDYDPGIPSDVTQSLLLPFKNQMHRLLRVENYLSHRRARARHQAPSIFRDYGLRHSFAVRYFDQSPEHQHLRQGIERHATQTRQQKLEELCQKKEMYRSLMRLHDQSQCEYYEVVVDDENDFPEQRHSQSCSKCRCRSQALKININIHEWPLPSDDLEARATVFELKVPPFIACWRDTALFLLLDVLEAVSLSPERPRSQHPLHGYNGLSSFFTRPRTSQRLMLLSENKPHKVTHRRRRESITVITESDVCLNNGLRYRYYHGSAGTFISDFHIGDQISKRLNYQVPTPSACLQRFLFRPPTNPSGPSPNTIIASQWECPEHMSLDEYKALCAIPLGYRIQWQNILLQLKAPSVDFKKVETSLVILQSIYQAGPPFDGDVLRAGHKVVGDERFANVLLESLHEALQRYRENWESSEAFSTFISVAARLLSLSTAGEIKVRCVAFLADARAVTFDWVNQLRGKLAEATQDRHRADLLHQAVKLALTCVDSFNIDDEDLDDVLASRENASVFIQCCIFLQENTLLVSGASDAMMKILLQRWKGLSYRSYPILARRIQDGQNRSLDGAIKKAWSTYVVGDGWRMVSTQVDNWLVSQIPPQGGLGRVSVHYNLLTGEVLANGLPLARLPSNYGGHSTYRILFGGFALDVMPTTMPGMQFSGKTDHAGHAVHFGIRSIPTAAHATDLLIRAVKDDRTYDFIPSRLFDGEVPLSFVTDFVHWYDAMEDCVEFRPVEDPWSSSPRNWKLTKAGGHNRWRLEKEGYSLISVKSETARLISEILSPLAEPLRIHTILHHSSSKLEIDLPRIQLAFLLQSGTSSLQSRQFRGMAIDPDQSLGTLVGLRSKLLLRHAGTGRRLVVVPEGSTSYQRNSDHVRVLVDHGSAVKAHAYHVDDRLGTLLDNGTLQSKLWLCYLHALTSFCLPDPLIQRTGTEQGLSILKSAAVRSFAQLTQENVDILHRIALLTPGRSHYPANERVMQTVKWASELSFLSQHGGFYKSVKLIFDQVERTKIFYSESYVEPPKLDHINPDLLERDCIRSSTFRVSGFGAEDDTDEHDATYSGRDTSQNSPAGSKAFFIASMVFLGRGSLHYSVQATPGARLWSFLSRENVIFGPDRPLPPSEIKYDAGLLQDWSETVARYWCALHRTLSRTHPRFDMFRLMMWLSTLAFAEDADVEIVQALGAFFVLPRMAQFPSPIVDSFQLSEGASFQKSELIQALRPAFRPLNRCPESHLTRRTNEAKSAWNLRRQLQFQGNQDRALTRLMQALEVQWPCESPVVTHDAETDVYVDTGVAMQIVNPKFQGWFDNYRLKNYLGQIGDVIRSTPVTLPVMLSSPFPSSARAMSTRQKFVSIDDIFTVPPPSVFSGGAGSLTDDLLLSTRVDNIAPRLESLLVALGNLAGSEFEKRYVVDLRASLLSLQRQDEEYCLHLEGKDISRLLRDHLSRCKNRVDNYSATLRAVAVACPDHITRDVAHVHRQRRLAVAASIEQGPRLSPKFFLQQLGRNRWQKISSDWKHCIVQYALALTELQRAERLVSLSKNHVDLIKELRNTGHTNWDPLERPESLLLEVESGIMIRDVQEQIACEMRDPQAARNAVMQLNMGEGKSSVIVPDVAAALADSSRLVRVIVAKPQSKQMLQMLVSKLGGLLHRRVYHMPFSRSLRLEEADAAMIDDMCRECMINGGILLVQPEHVLSFKLMGLECLIGGKNTVARRLLRTQEFFDNSSRDIVDESDENFSVKFELIYTMGMQRPIELSPRRWICIQEVLELVKIVSPVVAQQIPASMEVEGGSPGSFPRTRVLGSGGQKELFDQIARHICEFGLGGFPIARQPENVRQAVFRYLTECSLSPYEIAQVESAGAEGFWTDTTSRTLLLLRGLIAGGILAFAFGQKRWRVHYGLASTRKPRTKLAVPYRAKDSPSPRSEFSHPDVVIVLTCLSHYYGGMEDDDLFLAFAHLLKSDQADVEYQAWVVDAPGLRSTFRQLTAINLKDHFQCIEQVFPPLRYAKNAIDYFLTHVVFPKEMREFPYKLSASGWDIGQKKVHATTGFSGTNDSRINLPLSVAHLDLGEQKHTNALVLEHLLRPENSVVLMPPPADVGTSSAKRLLAMVTEMDPSPQVILDVGAQILELSNLEVAIEWLRMVPDHELAQAVVFVDGEDELAVLDRKGRTEHLQTSPFATHLDVCLVFLDEAHTRGTDLKLPEYYRAAVTLGASLTKDRLVQACMRMRKLGHGQSVVFCIPQEIHIKILARTEKSENADVNVSDVLSWAVAETCIDAQRSMPLWAVQGQRFEYQCELWAGARVGGDERMSEDQAKRFLEDESRSLEQRYRPGLSTDIMSSIRLSQNVNLQRIVERCREFDDLEHHAASLQEEQERELSPEIVQQREVQRPAPATPVQHRVHPDLTTFVTDGTLINGSVAFKPAFETLRCTSAAAHIDVSQFSSDLLVTADFANTVKVASGPSLLDVYQRPVQWVLTSVGGCDCSDNIVRYMVIVSPYEAHALQAKIRQSKAVTLHLYAPRLNAAIPALDGLDLYAVSGIPVLPTLPRRFVTQLNLFAGQLYLGGFNEYIEVCATLGLAWEKAGVGSLVAADGFIIRDGNGGRPSASGFRESPVQFLHVFLTKIRRTCEEIDKTHMGAVLDGRILQPSSFAELIR